MADYDKETGIKAEYRFFIKAIEVHFDRSWTPGSSVSLHEGSYGGMERMFRKKGCPKAFRWKPRQPKGIWGDIIIEYAKEGWERSDVTVTMHEFRKMASSAEYDSQGDAHIEIKNVFAFGNSTTILNAHRIQYYFRSELMINVALEFGDSEECFRFIQHGIKKVHMGRFDNDDAVINDVYEKVTPLAIDHRRAELAALRRGLSKYDFDDERVQPPTQVACHRASPSDNHARPCVLMLHLEVWTGDPNRGCLVLSAHWSATDFLPSYPSCSNPFQYLTSFHSSDPASAAQSHDLSSSRHSGALNITISAHGISVLDGTSTVSARNGLTINGVNRAIIINHISAIMGDYFGIVNGGNAGGTNNTNYAHSYAR